MFSHFTFIQVYEFTILFDVSHLGCMPSSWRGEEMTTRAGRKTKSKKTKVKLNERSSYELAVSAVAIRPRILETICARESTSNRAGTSLPMWTKNKSQQTNKSSSTQHVRTEKNDY